MSAQFPQHHLHGSHYEVGRQHGEALRPMIRGHLELIYTQGAQRSNLAPETARRWALAFGSMIGAAAPHFLDKSVLRDHANRPHSICAHPGERVSYSFASIISDLEAGAMEVAVGPPCEHDYVRYELRA